MTDLLGDHGGQRLSFDDFASVVTLVCPILLGLVRIGQEWQSSWARLRNFKDKVNKSII